jgi:stearoyl-CoA desaturase (delta-9 desaturase)
MISRDLELLMTLRIPDSAGASTSADPGPLPMTREPHLAALWLERGIAAAIVLVPLAGTVAAAALAWRDGIAPRDLALCAGFYVATMLGITVGFHRLFSHKSFEAAPALRAILAVLGSMALQGPPIRWVADHRRHHSQSDGADDPHSPVARGAHPLRGLWHAHWGWFFGRRKTVVRRFAPDLLGDAQLQAIDRRYGVWAVLSLSLPALLGLALGGTAGSALTGFLWGGLVRVFLVHHVTWSVNSLCHVLGGRPFASRDASTNFWPVALLTFGEGWHNNHHAFPASARHGLLRGQVDGNAWLIGVLARLGWVWDVKLVTAEQMARRRRACRRTCRDA